jgi:hypothetical protein
MKRRTALLIDMPQEPQRRELRDDERVIDVTVGELKELLSQMLRKASNAPAPEEASESDWIGTKEFTRITGYCAASAKNLEKRGLKVYRPSKGKLRFRRSEVEEWMRTRGAA